MMSIAPLLALQLWPIEDPRWPMVAAGAVVVLGLLVFGFRDVIRFSARRAFAIGSVCFSESIRRRVLWLIPLAIAGVLLVSQFQRPLDEQDALRQTTRFCMFAAGLLVTMVTIILACTNLPREIENRVIYSVVTKPTTRLEIIAGKIGGFAAVSGTILLIMAVFTWGFLQYRQWSMLSDVRQRLEAGTVPQSARPTLAYYASHGVLSARNYQRAEQSQFFSRLPDPDSPLRWMSGGGEGRMLVPFSLNPQRVRLSGNPDEPAMQIEVHVSDWMQRPLTENELPVAAQLMATTQPASASATMGPALPSEVPAAAAPATVSAPFIQIDIFDQNQTTILTADMLANGGRVYVPSKSANNPAVLTLTNSQAQLLARARDFVVAVTAVSPGTELAFGDEPVSIRYPGVGGDERVGATRRVSDGAIHRPIFVAGGGNPNSLQLRGASENAPMSVVEFREVKPELDAAGNAVFEFRCVIERSGETTDEMEQPTNVQFVARNNVTKGSSAALIIPVESRRAAYFTLPGEFVREGNFDVIIRCVTPNHWINVGGNALLLSSANRSFTVNLGKSFLVLWFFSLLVITVSIFCSTFVSWPIAVVLTLVILLGHWGVEQIADTARPGFGRTFANELFRGANAPVVETVSRSVEHLNQILLFAKWFLPDVSRFAALESLERGNAMPLVVITQSLLVLAVFALPVAVLSYVFLRNKEVAP
jgi:hypothetical protein